MVTSFITDLVQTWAIDPEDHFSSKLHNQMMNWMPQYYWESEFLVDYFKCLSTEFDLFRIMLEPYHVREIGRLINNEEGWGFEKLLAQRFIVAANHYLPKWLGLLNMSGGLSYRNIKERLKIIFSKRTTITPGDLKDIISILSDIPVTNIQITEDFANYAVTIGITYNLDSNLINFIEDKVHKVVPAHLDLTFVYSVCQLDDSPPCELGDVGAVLLGSL